MSNVLTISILAETANAQRNIQGVSNELTGMSGVAAKVGANLKTLAAGFIGFEAISFLAERIRRASDAVQEQEKLLAQTNAVLKSTGATAGVTADEVLNLSDAIEKKSLIDAEQIQAGQNLLLTFTNIRNEAGAGNDIFTQTTQIMADLSTAMGQSTATSATQLGKALNDPIKGVGALTKVGVTFTQQQKDQIAALVESGDVMGAQKIILAELAKEFGGSAAASADTFAGRLKHLNDDLDTLFEEGVSAALPLLSLLIEGFSAVLPVLAGIGSAISSVAGFFTDLPLPIQVAIASLAAIALLKGPVVSMFETIALRALYARDAVVASSVGMGTLRTAGSGLVGLFGGPWGIALAAGVTGLTLLTSWLSSSSSAASDAAGFQKDLASALEQSNGVIDDNVRALAAQKAADTEVGDSNLLEVAQRLGFDLPTVTDALLGNEAAYRQLSQAAEDYYDQSLLSENAGDLEFTQNADDARLFADALGELAPTMSRTQAEQALLTAATAQTGGVSGDAANAVSEYTGELEEAEDAAKAVKDATDQFKTSLELLTGSSVSMAQVESQLQKAYADSTTALEGLDGSVVSATGSFDLNTEAGRAAFDTLNDITGSSNELISTMLAQGRSADEVRARDAQLRASFVQTAQTMGFTEAQAENLANQYYGIPSDRYTRIDSNAASVAGQVSNLATQIANLPEYKRIGIQAVVSTLGFGSMFGFAEGGYTGNGSKYQPAGIVHAGEWVLTSEQVNDIGLSNLRAAFGNNKPTGSYANGGYVGGVGNTYNLNVTAAPGMTEEQAGALFKKAILKAERAGMA